jgi:hypothetical protein
MSEQKQNGQMDLKEYADGWMTERKGTDAPGFLKLVIPIIGLGCTAYLFLQIYGDVGHATRGPLVQQFNTVSQTSPVFSYIIAAMALVYVVIVAKFAFSKPHED